MERTTITHMRRRWCILCVCLAVLLVPVVAFTQFGTTNPIYIDDSPTASNLIQQARTLRQQNRLADAAAMYQRVMTQFPYKLTGSSEELYVDMILSIRRELLGDAELLDAYRKINEPSAARAMQFAWESGPDLPAMLDVVQRYALCPSGLEASLRLAGQYLERGDPISAAMMLDQVAQHPDLPQHGARWHLLQAASGLFGRMDQRLMQHHDALVMLNETQAIASLVHWQNTLEPPQRVGLSAGQLIPLNTAIPESLDQPMWELRTTREINDSTPLRGRRVAVIQMPGSPNEFSLGMAPVADQQHVYVHQGWSMLAIDRASGRTLWKHDAGEGRGADTNVQRMMIQRGQPVEPRAAAIEGDNVVAILGFSSPIAGRWNNEQPGSYLACVNRQDGKLRWQVEPTELDNSLRHVYFTGSPIISDNRVFAILVRAQVSGQQDVYVVAVDVTTGKLLWRRYLSSATIGGRLAGVTIPRMTVHQGMLYVADYMSTVSCMETSTGMIHWLRLMPNRPDAMVGRIDLNSSPLGMWRLTDPIIHESGLIIPPADPRSSALLLDAQSGRLIRELTQIKWSPESYLRSVPDGVLSVGRTITLYKGPELALAWSVTLPASQERPQGSVAVTREQLFVPLADRLEVYSMVTGKRIAERKLKGTGNVVALDNQVLIAGADIVRSYMAWEHAFGLLNEQIKVNPSDPRPALSLAHMALSANQPQIVIQAVDQALAALHRQASATGQSILNQQDPQNRALFQQLLELVDPKRTASADLRRALFDRLATATIGPTDEAAYQLALGEFLVEIGQHEEAVDHYQAILLNPELTTQHYTQDIVTRQAGIEATLRLRKLVQSPAAPIYARYESLASQRLLELSSQESPDPNALIDLAQRYPLARSAPNAMLAAAEIYARTGRPHAAISLMRRIYMQHPADKTAVQRVVGRLVKLNAETDRPQQALQWLERVKTDHPGLRPLLDGRPVDPAQWAEQIQSSQSVKASGPRLTLPLRTPVLIDSKLLVPLSQPQMSWPRDRFVTLDNRKLRMRDARTLGQLWEQAVSSDETQILAINDQDVLVWQPEVGTLMSLNSRSGQLIWSSDQVMAAYNSPAPMQKPFRPFDGVQTLRGDVRGMILENRPDALQGAGLFVLVNDTTLCISDGNGRIIAIDRITGQLLWRTTVSLQILTAMTLNDDMVVLAGIVGDGGEGTRPVVHVFNAGTGEPSMQRIEFDATVRWLSFFQDRLLVVGTNQRIEARRLSDGSQAWVVPFLGTELASDDQSQMPLLALRDTAHEMVPHEVYVAIMAFIDPATSQVVQRMIAGQNMRGGGVDVKSVDNQWFLLSQRSAMGIAPDGRTVWRDAIAGFNKQYRTQLVSNQYVVLVADQIVDSPMPIAGTSAVYSIYVLDRQTGSLLVEYAPISTPQALDPSRTMLLNGNIVLAMTTQTLVIPAQ